MAKKELTPEQRERLRKIGFQKGKSGNPKGVPLMDEALKTKIRMLTPQVIDRLFQIAMDEDGNAAASVKALEILMSYTLSKAATKQEVDVTVSAVDNVLLMASRRHNIIDADFSEVAQLGAQDDDLAG